MIETYTNTALATARRCMRQFELRYGQQLELDGEDREVLQVGQAWHHAFDAQHKGGNPFEAIAQVAPGPLWTEKLRRLFAAYAWYWKEQELQLVEAEHTFRIEVMGVTFEGQIDGIIEMKDGRRGILERKTTSDDLGATSSFWDRLRLDVQVGLYSLAVSPRPDFILYDVVRKPTIAPKKITKADATRMRAELTSGQATYFETLPAEMIEEALELGRETPALYGARLTADIGNRPEHYFARREVPRTSDDYDRLLEDLGAQVDTIENVASRGFFHRNPDACNVFGSCDFFALCSRNARPLSGEAPPEGFRRRAHLHPELVDEPQQETS